MLPLCSIPKERSPRIFYVAVNVNDDDRGDDGNCIYEMMAKLDHSRRTTDAVW